MTKENNIKMKNNVINTTNILERYKPKSENLITLLQDVQKNNGYISEENMETVCDYVGVPISRGYSVATFYQSFKLTPQGEHEIKVCLGTACHLKGSGNIMDELERKFKVKPGETTKDMKVTYSSVNCVGACAIAPVVIIDDKYCPSTNIRKIKKNINNFI